MMRLTSKERGLKQIPIRDHSFSAFPKFFKKLTFLSPRYAHVRTCAYQGLRNISLLENFTNVLYE